MDLVFPKISIFPLVWARIRIVVLVDAAKEGIVEVLIYFMGKDVRSSYQASLICFVFVM